MISSIIWAIITGLFIGLLGRLIVPGHQKISLLMTTLIGIVASLVAGVVLGALAYNNNNGGIPWLSIIVGAILAAGGILLYGNMTKKSV
jgi:uncharacterized membrane protein YeaQ/YmgE (transglycosylase-associated protein family)